MAEKESVPAESADPRKRIRNSFEKHVTATSQLIGRDDVELVTRRDSDGDTLLHIAVAKGNEGACEYLVDVFKRAEVTLDLKNNILQTPLHIACIVDSPKIVTTLLNANPFGCSVPDRHGNNCVHLAVKHSSTDTGFSSLKAVLEVAPAKALEYKNLYGYTPMHVAAMEGKHDAIRLLKAARADINALDNRGGASPLILATKASQREAAQALLELGANPSLRTTYGETAPQLASAKGDHVIGELLALYDPPCDSTKSSSLTKYMGDTLAAASRSQHKQHTSVARHREYKMKPFVSARMPHPIPSFVPTVPFTHAFYSLPTGSRAVVVKSERRSPTRSFPSTDNNRPVVACSPRRGTERPMELVVRKDVRKRGTSPESQILKRKCDPVDGPLDLSVKRAKNDRDRANSNPRSPAQKFAFVKPNFHPSSGVVSKSRPEASAQWPRTSSTSASSFRTNSNETTRALSIRHTHSMTSSDVASSLHPVAFRSTNQKPSFLRGECRKQSSSSDCNYSNTEKVAIHQSAEPGLKGAMIGRDGFFYPALVSSDYYQAVAKNASLSRSPPAKKSFFESRDKSRPIKERILNGCVQNHSSVEQFTKARGFHHTDKKHHLSEQVTSFSPALQSRASANDVFSNRTPQSSINRERRYQSDGAYPATMQSADRQFINRRNSAPVQTKTNDKRDLRSYTGCLPPHFLHLLESSGNLPIRQPNALRNVSEVFTETRVPTDFVPKSEKPEPKNESDSSKHSTPVSSGVITSNVSSLDCAPNISAGTSTPDARMIPTTSACAASTTPLSIGVARPTCDHFLKLGDWNSIEYGEYPAFGQPPQIAADQIKPAPHHPVAQESFKIDEKYISEKTRQILEGASSRPPPKARSAPSVRSVAVSGKIHSCPGCSNHKKQIPPLVADIWRYQPLSSYVTSACASPDVVYCWQLESKNSSVATPKDCGKSYASTESNPSRSISTSVYTERRAVNEGGELPPTTSNRPGSMEKRCKDVRFAENDVTALASNRTGDFTQERCVDGSDAIKKERTSASVESRATQNGVSFGGQALSAKNGFHRNISEAILKNFECYSEVLRRLRTAQLVLVGESKDSYKDLHLSDLEISDDDETNEKEKPKI